MVRNTEEAFLKQIDNLEEIKKVLEHISKGINEMGEARKYDTDLEDMVQSARLRVFRRSLVRFIDIFTFLVEKLRSEDQELFMHYLPNARCLFDIYARVIYFLDCSDELAAMASVAESIKKVAIIIATSNNNVDGLKDAYNEEVEYYRIMFESQGIQLPDDPLKFSGKFLAKNNIGLPKIELMLSSQRVEKFTPKARKVWITAADNPYTFYRHFSSYAHGDEINEKHGNEILWISSKMQMLGLMIAECLDSHVLNEEHAEGIRNILDKTSKSLPEWIEYWKTRTLTLG